MFAALRAVETIRSPASNPWKTLRLRNNSPPAVNGSNTPASSHFRISSSSNSSYSTRLAIADSTAQNCSTPLREPSSYAVPVAFQPLDPEFQSVAGCPAGWCPAPDSHPDLLLRSDHTLLPRVLVFPRPAAAGLAPVPPLRNQASRRSARKLSGLFGEYS